MFQNLTGKKVDAFNYSFVFYNTYGKRYAFSETLTEELDVILSEERDTLSNKQKMTLSGLVVPSVYLAGGLVCVTSYHTTDGETVEIPDDERHWFGFGKGVAKGYNETAVTPLSDTEKKRSDAWELGVTGRYVDADWAAEYNVREGMLVLQMEKDSPMDLAGLQSGDILLAVGDVRIFGATSLKRAEAHMNPGESAPALYWRNGSVYITTVVYPDGSEAI